MSIRVNLHGKDRVKARLRRLSAQARRSMAAALVREGEALLADSKPRVPVDLGALRASGVVSRPRFGPLGVRVEVGFGGAAAPYAVYVHEGRRAGSRMPPLRAIREWVTRHGMPPSAAYPVARAIARRGVPAQKYLEEPFRMRLPGIVRRMGSGFRASFRRG